MNDILTAKQIGVEYFDNKVSYWKVLQLAREDGMPHFWIGNRLYSNRAALDRWIAKRMK